MTIHLVRLVALTALLLLALLYPFLPGRYDPLAVGLSTLAQLIGVGGLLLAPLGVLWLLYELRQRGRQTPRKGGYFFALVSLILATLLTLLISILFLLGVGASLGVLALAGWFFLVSRWWPVLKRLKTAEAPKFNPAPLYLTFLPIALVLAQVALAAPVNEFSRNRVIANSAELIQEIETHRAAQGRYPASLLAINHDFLPGVVGVTQYYYAASGDAYNLAFEQPRFLFHDIGAREWVVYNPLDQHVIASHVYWILIWTPAELADSQGWFAVHDAGRPHWKYFLFD